ncbi:MAG: hypothetical protein SVX43_10850, partial [Cyanobacteriota bacterium]|nr:hypothetical protein [Cyanobacteriota bacterium]
MLRIEGGLNDLYDMVSSPEIYRPIAIALTWGQPSETRSIPFIKQSILTGCTSMAFSPSFDLSTVNGSNGFVLN